jgi:predicted nucleotidyltransferase
MKTTAQRQRTKTTKPAVPSGWPDLPWYRDAQNRQKRMAHIQTLCQHIAQEFQPEKIILFGSQAYGQSTIESDVDLLVVMPYEGSPFRQAGEILKRLKVWMPVDLIVRSAADIEQRLNLEDKFMRDILERGKVMYESSHG